MYEDKKINLEKLDTECRNSASMKIDQASTEEILKIINNEDAKIAPAVGAKIDVITKAVDDIYQRFIQNGRLIYIGAGSSGRIGVLDISEMFPTYGISNDQMIGVIAGGDKALRNSEEGAEDDYDQGIRDLQALNLTSFDSVMGICASGRTPYVLGALNYTKQIGALAIGLCMTKQSEMEEIVDHVIAIDTGPEVITGSTRMKAGTATKLICNMISTTLMIKLGKVYENLMVDVVATNEKLKHRVAKIIAEITGEKQEKINEVLKNANYQCKNAIIMLTKNVTYPESVKLLEQYNNQIKDILNK